MSNPILETKLYHPAAQPVWVKRNRLIEKLNDSFNSKLTLVSAPAGFGKTTLLSEWIEEANLPAAWVSLDPGDNDPKRFLTYCIAALRTIHPEFGRTTESLIQSSQTSAFESIVTTFINEISSNHLKESVLILDDYHLIDSREVHSVLAFFLEHMPPNLHLIIASRHDPPLALARLRVRKQLCEIREADLRFSLEETANFFKQTMRLNISEEDISALEERTEGWVASLQLAGLALRGRKDIHRFIKDFTGSHNYIVDYLTEEVLQHLDSNMQEFLLYTSVLNRFNSNLCDSVTGGIESQGILEYLDKSKLFLVPLDENRKWFRYHHLFSDLLRYRLGQLFPQTINLLHQRASKWFEENGYTEDAINHALEAGDEERAADLIEKAAVPALVNAELVTLKSWTQKISPKLIAGRAYILISLAWVHNISGEIEKTEPLIRDAENLLQNNNGNYDENEVSDINGHIALIRSYRYSPFYKNNPDISRQRELILKAKAYLRKDNPTLQSTLELVLGWTYSIAGEWEKAKEAFTNALVYGETSNNHIVALSGVQNLIEILLIQGRLKQAYNTCLNTLEKYEAKYGSNFLPLGFVYLVMGKIFYQMNDFNSADEYLEHSAMLAELMGGWGMFFHAITHLALVKQKKGEISRVKGLIRKEEEVKNNYPSFFREIHIETQRASLWLCQNNLKALRKWLENFNEDPLHDTDWFLIGKIISARILILSEEYFEALNLLDDIYSQAKKTGANGLILETLILKAVVYKREGETDLAESSLREALILAEPEGYIHLFVNEGKIMQDMLNDILANHSKKNSISTAYITQLIEGINNSLSKSDQPLQEPLSERELDVLRLLAAGYSNKEIADKLFVAVGTIKKHTHQIYQKLNVENRTKAIQTAKELNLI